MKYLHKKATDRIRSSRSNVQVAEYREVLNSITNSFSYIVRVCISSETCSVIKANAFFQTAFRHALDFIVPEHQESYLRFIDPKRISTALHWKHPSETLDLRLVTAENKEHLWVRATIILASMHDDHVESYLFTCSDISCQKNEEQRRIDALHVAFASAKQANAAKSDFLSRVSHDLRTPMNAIIGMTSLARTCTHDPAKLQMYLDKISLSSQHLMDLINEILDMSRIESGRFILTEENFNLYHLISNLILMIQPQTQLKEQELRVNISGIRHADVVGDGARLQQCFLNFISNAVKYTPRGGQITVSVYEKDCNYNDLSVYEFVFEDNGCGMSPEFIDHIFEPFSRDETGCRPEIQGTGLGMAIAYHIIHIMNGNIKVESRQGSGSRFTVALAMKRQQPIRANDILLFKKKENAAKAQENAAANKTPSDLPEERNMPQPPVAYDFRGKRILLAEDNDINRDLACDMLSMTGAEVECAENGREALEMVAASPLHHFDLILMDLRMPVMSGCEASRSIRRLPREDVSSIPIFAMTANVYPDDIRKSTDAGMCEHISKPIHMQSLFETMKKWLG